MADLTISYSDDIDNGDRSDDGLPTEIAALADIEKVDDFKYLTDLPIRKDLSISEKRLLVAAKLKRLQELEFRDADVPVIAVNRYVDFHPDMKFSSFQYRLVFRDIITLMMVTASITEAVGEENVYVNGESMYLKDAVCFFTAKKELASDWASSISEVQYAVETA